MRVLLSKESKLRLYNILKLRYSSSNLKELSSKMEIPFKTLQKWIYEEKRYIPSKIIPEERGLDIIDKKEDSWGQSEGGKIGGKRSVEKLMQKVGKKKYNEIMRQRGKKLRNTIWKRYGKEELMRMIIRGKFKKREEQSRKLEEQHLSFFENKQILLDSKNVQFSNNDVKKMIKLPNKVTKELSEEIGIHLGDGCMSFNRNYFSVKTNKKEEKYVTEFLIPLYKKLYNIELKLMQLKSVSGFEICSKAICEFKNKSLGLPYGEKINKIKIPKEVIETKNKKLYCSLIRGLFDTDGCLYISNKNNKSYPVISITIKSEELIQQVEDMLRKMGYLAYSNKKSYIALNGPVMLKKWIKEIGSNNPKNIEKLKQADSITWKVHNSAVHSR